MRLLWHSSNPTVNTGYGIASKEIGKRLMDARHYVRFGTKHPDHGSFRWRYHESSFRWHDYEIFNGIDTRIVNDMLEYDKFDYIITFWDLWSLHKKRMYPKDKWVAYVTIDTEWISDQLASVIQNAGTVIAMSKHGEREIKSIGLKPLYIPLGIDTNVFKIDEKARKDFRASLGFTDENFVIGSVGLNYGDDRKGFIPLMRAFKDFHETHPEARLFIHTLANHDSKKQDRINYKAIGDKLGISKYLYWPQQDDYELCLYDDKDMAAIYNGFDVFCLPTKGEGFGIPIIEAQACGVPVVVTNTTTADELVKTGWKIKVDSDDLEFVRTSAWRYVPKVSNIFNSLQAAWNFWQTKAIKPETVRERVLKYGWSNVWDKYWLPILEMLEDKLKKGRV